VRRRYGDEGSLIVERAVGGGGFDVKLQLPIEPSEPLEDDEPFLEPALGVA
jgi:hypothetical protein